MHAQGHWALTYTLIATNQQCPSLRAVEVCTFNFKINFLLTISSNYVAFGDVIGQIVI